MRKNDEAQIQAGCVAYFYQLYAAPYGMLFMNYNNPKSARHGVNLKRAGLVPGVADLTLLTPRGVVYIEVKTRTGRQSDRQKKWQKLVETLGYRYEIVRSVQEFLELTYSILGRPDDFRRSVIK